MTGPDANLYGYALATGMSSVVILADPCSRSRSDRGHDRPHRDEGKECILRRLESLRCLPDKFLARLQSNASGNIVYCCTPQHSSSGCWR